MRKRVGQNIDVQVKILTREIVITKTMEQTSSLMPMNMHSGLAWSLMATAVCKPFR